VTISQKERRSRYKRIGRSLTAILLFYYYFLNIYFNLTSQYYKCVKLFLSLLPERREMGDPIKPSGSG
jgi:hypothetical protein